MSAKSNLLRLGVTGLAGLVPALASAHVGMGEAHGFTHGFLHPIGGVDHVLAMVAVGIFAASLGGRALAAMPVTFTALMAIGAALGVAGVSLPFVEIGIALSIVAFGLAVAIRTEWPLTIAMALVGVFAIFHGHAHGTEMPLNASGLAFGAGFVVATGVLHLAGIATGLAIGTAGEAYSRRIAQAGGAAVALGGIAILAGVV